jgi:hypothetical protein
MWSVVVKRDCSDRVLSIKDREGRRLINFRQGLQAGEGWDYGTVLLA